MGNEIGLLKKLVEVNSHTENKAGVDRVGGLIAAELGFMELTKYSHPTRGDLLVFKSKATDDSRSKLILSGHSDTVFKSAEKFPLKLAGNKLFGPGVVDMKGGLVVIIETLKRLQAAGKLTNVTFCLVPDEEQGSLAFKDDLAEIYRQHDYGFVFEEGTLEATPSITDYKSLRRALVIGRKGYGVAEFTVTAPGGHSGALSSREQRSSANEELAHKLLALEELADYQAGTTLNPGIISGGTAPNIIAASAKLTTDYRVRTAAEAKRVQKGLDKLASKNFRPGTTTELSWKFQVPPLETTRETEGLAQKLKATAQKLAEPQEIIFEQRGGGSDANYMSAAGMVALDGFGPQGGDEHTLREFIYLDSLKPAIDFVYAASLTL